ncbi:MAG TPA: tetratricopeptide repeat protein, partial [Candidatus Krumholzibacteria bacterium]|nr:tetratricopeptide repeat protein [Candidatus Krumholzibacteria bacterium]
MIITRVIDIFITNNVFNSSISDQFRACFKDENYSDCATLFEAICQHPGNDAKSNDAVVCSWGILAWLYFIIGDIDRAEYAVEKYYQCHNDMGPSIPILEGWLLLHKGKARAAVEHIRATIKSIKSHAGYDYISSALFMRGMAHYRVGSMSTAIEDLKSASSIARVSNDDFIEISAMNSLGLVLMTLGKLDESSQVLKKAYTICEMAGNKRKLAQIAHNISIVRYKHGDFHQLKKYGDKSIQLIKKSEDKTLLPSAVLMKAKYLYETGDIQGARAILLQLIKDGCGSDARVEPLVIEYLGDIAVHQKNRQSAEMYYLRAKSLGMMIAPDGDIVAECLRRLASLR